MAINLVKGENRVLNMNLFHVGLGWDVNEGLRSLTSTLMSLHLWLGRTKKH